MGRHNINELYYDYYYCTGNEAVQSKSLLPKPPLNQVQSAGHIPLPTCPSAISYILTELSLLATIDNPHPTTYLSYILMELSLLATIDNMHCWQRYTIHITGNDRQYTLLPTIDNTHPTTYLSISYILMELSLLATIYNTHCWQQQTIHITGNDRQSTSHYLPVRWTSHTS